MKQIWHFQTLFHEHGRCWVILNHSSLWRLVRMHTYTPFFFYQLLLILKDISLRSNTEWVLKCMLQQILTFVIIICRKGVLLLRERLIIHHNGVFDIPKWDVSHLASKKVYRKTFDDLHWTRESPKHKSASNCWERLKDWLAWPWINSVYYRNQSVKTHRGPNILSRHLS